jgi:hypothetical protein
MFATKHDPAILEFEDDAAQRFQLSAIPLCAVVVNGDDAAVLAFEHVQQIGSERAARLSEISAELREDRLTPHAVAGDGGKPWRVPGGSLAEQLRQRSDIGSIEGLVGALNDVGVAARSPGNDPDRR